MPASPCGPDCVDTDYPAAGAVRRALRVAAALGVLLSAPVLLPPVLVLPRAAGQWLLRGWFRALVRAFGARLDVHGAARYQDNRGRGVLVAGNHVSWLDELVVDAVQPIRMVAKLDIRDWPVLGRLITLAGTVYLDRERLRRLPGTVAELADALRAGAAVGIHAEGTTWCGRGSGPFRPALFQAALDAGVPVRPIALRYRLGDGTSTSRPAFVGDETLLDSIRRVLHLRGLVVEVHVLDEIAPGRAGTRRELAALAQAAVTNALNPVGALTPVGTLPAQRSHPPVTAHRVVA
jgi:1-acyl-sn-glycerol-3-phosphate acyltransferase